MAIEITHHGVKLPKFVPCIGGQCPELMQLKGEYAGEPFYQCMREAGYESSITGELYTAACHYNEFPYPAADFAYWHRNAEKKTDQDTHHKTAV